MGAPIIFNTITANVLSTNSMISVGENNQPNWSSHSKNNTGVSGSNGFVNTTTGIINWIMDNDIVDTPITYPNLLVTPQNQIC